MMILISGQPGNGKTLKALDLARIEYERNAEAVKAGKEQPREFYSNIAGASTDENPNAFPWLQPMPEHRDWQKLPKGSYVIYDEAHADGNTEGLERYGRLFPSTGKPGESDDPRIRSMSTHRHGGYDLVFVTQWPSKVHHNVRQLVGKHVHMNRAMGLQSAGVLSWTRVQPDPYDEKQREKAEEEIWRYAKDLYTRYFSATLHTSSYQFKIPGKVWQALSVGVMVLVIVWGIYSWVSGDSSDEPKARAAQAGGSAAPGASSPSSCSGSGSVQLVGPPETGRYTALRAPATPKIIGYIDSPRGCRMWGEDGNQLDISQADCVAMVKQGVPLSFMATSERRQARQPSNAQGEHRAPVDPAASAPSGSGAGIGFGGMANYGNDAVGAY